MLISPLNANLENSKIMLSMSTPFYYVINTTRRRGNLKEKENSDLQYK